jgi:peptidoglycan/LPS O-acetylase OafA/YrhL
VRYRPALDGIRALAVLAVLALHVGYFDGGYQGVDVFFVLSGYLISSILLAEQEKSGRIDFRAFYVRRFLRLYPALIVLLVGVPVASLLAAYERKRFTAEAMLYALTYITNIAHTAGRGASFFLDHTWSLAIEEQFYLLWPLVLVLLVARLATRRAAALTLAGAALVLWALYALVTWHWSAADARNLPPTDSLELVAGAVLAFAPSWALPARTPTAPILALGGFALVAAVLPRQGSVGFGYWGIAVTAAASLLLIGHAIADGALTTILAWEPLVWLGRRSYGLYLYHFPIAAVIHLHIDSKTAAAALTVVVSITAAALSYRYVEQPFLRRKHRFERVPAAGRPDA